MDLAVYDDHGIRFEYPDDWDMEEVEDGVRTTVSLQSPTGLAFAFVTVDEDSPSPVEVLNEALEALRSEYNSLDETPATETIDGHRAVGHDIEFFSLDVTTICSTRCFRTPRRTVLVFGQYSELEEVEAQPVIRGIRRSLEETDV